MSRILLQIMLRGLGVAALAVGAGIFLFGPQAVAMAFVDLLAALLPGTFGMAPDIWPRDADNEMRFYAVFWFAFGACLIMAARSLAGWRGSLPLLIGLFFAGGIGLAISIAQSGLPHPMFVTLMWIELSAPVAMAALYWSSGIVSQRAKA